jgi:putative heme-binding domain-containing protein
MPNAPLPALFSVLTTIFAQQEPPLVAPDGPRAPAEQQKMFHLPPGFKIELVAAEPDIRKPMNLAFDRWGHLFVTQSVEYPYPAKEGSKPRDTVRVFYDSGVERDGLPDKSHVFVDGLNIPIGVCTVGDDAIVYSIPSIRRYQGLGRLAKANGESTLFTGFGSRDTHGMASSFTRWIDGWIYACHGFANQSKVAAKERPPVEMQSGNTYRFTPDGRRIEQWTWGQVNPFGMAFDALGNQYTADCHTKPVYNLLRGAYYPSFEKPHDGLGFGPEMMQHLHGSTGIAGVVVYDADGFPAEFRNNLFIGNPVTGRINRDRLEYVGSTPKAVEMPDFLSCDDLWFRPVDVKLAPDGSLYIADFYNCMIGHYEVPLDHPRRDRERGRIWRVSHESMPPNPRVGPKRGLFNEPALGEFALMSAERLVSLLGHPNITVRVGATNELVDRREFKTASLILEGAEGALRAKLKDSSSDARVHAMWALERIFGLSAAEANGLRKDSDRKVRTHVAKLLAERPQPSNDEREWLQQSLKDGDAFVRRASADALGRRPISTQIPLLLAALKKASVEDAALVHTLRMALRDHLKSHPAAFGDEYPPAERGRIADVALGVPTEPSGDFMVGYLAASGDRSRLSEMVNHAIRRCSTARLDEAMEVVSRFDGVASWSEQNTAVRAASKGFAQRGSPLRPRLQQWIDELAAVQLNAADAGSVRQGLELVRDLKVGSAFATTASLIKPQSKHADLRGLAMDAAAAANPEAAVSILKAVLGEAREPTELRRKAAENLGSLVHLAESRSTLAAQLPLASQELSSVIARGMSRNADAARDLAKLLDERKASVLLARDPEVHNNLSRAKLPDYEARRTKWLKDAPSEDAALAKLLDERRKWATAPGADLKAGEAAFAKYCGACHQMANKGAKIGPQLDGIGVRDVDRLLEDMLAPSRNVDQAFRTTQLLLKDGRAISGLFLREEGAVVVVADHQGKEQRFEKSAIEERRFSPVSPMPADVGTRLTKEELRDMIAFLRLQRTQAKK